MYEVARACARGDLRKCSCAKKSIHSNSAHNKQISDYKWNGCGDDFLYAHMLSKRFVDSKEYYQTVNDQTRLSELREKKQIDSTQNDLVEEKLINLHNNEVGRRVRKSKKN